MLVAAINRPGKHSVELGPSPRSTGPSSPVSPSARPIHRLARLRSAEGDPSPAAIRIRPSSSSAPPLPRRPAGAGREIDPNLELSRLLLLLVRRDWASLAFLLGHRSSFQFVADLVVVRRGGTRFPQKLWEFKCSTEPPRPTLSSPPVLALAISFVVPCGTSSLPLGWGFCCQLISPAPLADPWRV